MTQNYLRILISKMSGFVTSGHRSVLLDEIVEVFNFLEGISSMFLDCTLGGGGHAQALLERNTSLRLLGVDRDRFAIDLASERLSHFGSRFCCLQANFCDLVQVLEDVPKSFLEKRELSNDRIPYRRANSEKDFYEIFDGVLLDLGVSSFQLDDPARGFSFQKDGPLDMRMDQSQAETAGELVNYCEQRELLRILITGGMGRREAQGVSAAVVKNRPYKTTLELASVIKEAVLKAKPRKNKTTKNSGHHPATVAFQALRIRVNQELQSIKNFLNVIYPLLKPGAKLAVISFHSFEDKLVAAQMRNWSRIPPELRELNIDSTQYQQGRMLTAKAIKPSSKEIIENPRARSALLRVFQKEMRGQKRCN